MSTDTTAARTRRYDASGRREAAVANREAVVAAAARLFAERGWSGTSVRDVAKAAGVSVETVYAAVGPKAELLRRAIDVSVVGDDEPVPLADRPEFRALSRGSLRERVEAVAAMEATMIPRTAPLHRVLVQAAQSDPDMAAVLRESHERQLASTRAALEAVTGGPVDDRLTQSMHALFGNDVYLVLTELSGWTVEEYRTWVADTVVRLLHNHEE